MSDHRPATPAPASSTPSTPAPSARLRLLLVEDDEVIGEATALNLERHDYAVTWCTDGLSAWRRFQDGADGAAFDVVLSDIMLPELDGVSLCRRVRDAGPTPFLLISARTDAIDIVTGLEAGADDYLTKPFDIQVLLARLRSVARRAEPRPEQTSEAPTPSEQQQFGDLTFDRLALELRRDGTPVSLTPTEMRLFLELADNVGLVLSRSTLLTRVWDYPDWEDDDHIVNVHIQRLRAKIGADRIETVRGFGYKLRR